MEIIRFFILGLKSTLQNDTIIHIQIFEYVDIIMGGLTWKKAYNSLKPIFLKL